MRVQIIFVKGADERQITENIQERIREGEKAELLVKQNWANKPPKLLNMKNNVFRFFPFHDRMDKSRYIIKKEQNLKTS